MNANPLNETLWTSGVKRGHRLWFKCRWRFQVTGGQVHSLLQRDGGRGGTSIVWQVVRLLQVCSVSLSGREPCKEQQWNDFQTGVSWLLCSRPFLRDSLSGSRCLVASLGGIDEPPEKQSKPSTTAPPGCCSFIVFLLLWSAALGLRIKMCYSKWGIYECVLLMANTSEMWGLLLKKVWKVDKFGKTFRRL